MLFICNLFAVASIEFTVATVFVGTVTAKFVSAYATRCQSLLQDTEASGG